MCTIGDGISMTWNVAQPPRVRSNSITHIPVYERKFAEIPMLIQYETNTLLALLKRGWSEETTLQSLARRENP